MHNYNVISKGEYNYKQTNEFLRVERFLIIRKKSERYLLLNFDNVRNEKVTAMTLQIDQYDARGNALGVVNVSYDDFEFAKGKFVLKHKIPLHRACMDFYVKILKAEYGNYVYCLGDNDIYVTYEKKPKPSRVNKEAVRKELGEDGFDASPRKFTTPTFVSVFAFAMVLVALVAMFFHLTNFKTVEQTFFLSNVRYAFVDGKEEGAEVHVVGYVGFGGNELVIPASVDKYNVTKIRDGAFKDNKSVHKLTVTGNVEIEQNAFSGCTKLKTVTLNNVKTVGASAFSGCEGLQNVSIYNANSIGDYAFSNCTSLKEVVIENSTDDEDMVFGMQVFKDSGKVGSVSVNQFIQYADKFDLFSGVQEIESLSLKNFNYSPYQAKDTAVNPLNVLFGGAECKVGKLHLGFIDSIPVKFTDKTNTALTSVSIDNLVKANVGDFAFTDCKLLTEFITPKKMSSVGEESFKNTAITSFDGSLLRTMGKQAFAGCTALTTFNTFASTPLNEIPENAFNGCTKLSTIFIPKSVTNIGVASFKDCGLTQVSFAEDTPINVINASTFEGCKSLTTFTIPQLVEKIDNKAFFGCSALDKIELPDATKTVGVNAFDGCESASKIVFGSGIETIENYAFNNCKAVTVLTVPKTIKKMGLGAFAGCSLTSISIPFIDDAENGKVGHLGYLFGANNYEGNFQTVPQTLTEVTLTNASELGKGAFYGLKRLRTINLPNTLVAIDEDAFVDLINLRYLSIPESVMEIDSSAFKNCYKLLEVEDLSPAIVVSRGVQGAGEYAVQIYTSAEQPRMLKHVVGENVIGKADDGVWYLLDCGASVVNLPDGLNDEPYVITKKYFCSDDVISEITLSKDLDKIGANAFTQSGLTKITANAGSDELVIEDGVFTELTTLTNVDFASRTMTEIKANAFKGCTSLKNVALNNNVTTLGTSAFDGCVALETINVPTQVETIGELAFNGCALIANINMQNCMHLLRIENKTFYGCTGLQNIDFSDALTSIGSEAFSGCSSLVVVDWSNGLKTIESKAFNGCLKLATVSVVGIETIEAEAFASCNELATLILGNNAISLGEKAFAGCEMLSVVSLGNSLNSIGNECFSGCIAISSLTIPSSTVTIGSKAFYNCSAITTVVFGGSSLLETIGDNAFNSCAELTSIKLPTNLKTLGSNAFQSCSKLTSANIPAVTSLGDYVFSGCNALSIVTLEEGLSASVMNSSTGKFNDCYYLHEVYDLAGLGVVVDNNDFDNVGFNALRVYSDRNVIPLATYKTNNGLTYKYSSDYLVIVDYDGTDKELTLNGVNISGKWYYTCDIARYAFSANQTLEKLTVNVNGNMRSSAFENVSALRLIVFDNVAINLIENTFVDCSSLSQIVTDEYFRSVQSRAFGDSNVTFYYDGDQDAWSVNPYSGNYGYAVYNFFDDCIHTENCWNFVDGEINTAIKQFTAKKVKLKATCTADGIKDVYCSDCNEVGGSEIIPARGHVIELVRTVDAKCTVDGYKDYKCANTATDEYLACSHTEREILNMLGHDHQYVLEKESTCTEFGSEAWICQREGCGDVLSRTKIDKIPHDHRYVLEKEPTCTEFGSEAWICTVCGNVRDRKSIAKLPHEYEHRITQTVSCTQQGKEADYCTVCGEMKSGSEIITPKLSHNYEWEITKQATCDSNGSRRQKCIDCGNIGNIETIIKLGHADEDGNHLCDRCNKIQEFNLTSITIDSAKAIVTVENNGFDVFKKNNSKISYSYDKENTEKTFTLTFTAKQNLKISFNINKQTGFETYATVGLKVNGSTVSGTSLTNRVISKGQVITITVSIKKNVTIPNNTQFGLDVSNIKIASAN